MTTKFKDKYITSLQDHTSLLSKYKSDTNMVICLLSNTSQSVHINRFEILLNMSRLLDSGCSKLLAWSPF